MDIDGSHAACEQLTAVGWIPHSPESTLGGGRAHSLAD